MHEWRNRAYRMWFTHVRLEHERVCQAVRVTTPREPMFTVDIDDLVYAAVERPIGWFVVQEVTRAG